MDVPTGRGKTPFQMGPVNLRIGDGETLVVIGENGSGKTTLIKLLLGLYSPEQGEILLNGEVVTADAMDKMGSDNCFGRPAVLLDAV